MPFRISVVVLAYDRKEFLARALASVEGQTFAPSQTEVIVVKNFEAPDSDRIILGHEWTSIRVDRPEVGPKLAAALEESRGDVIAFLDDDDEWEPSKLAALTEAFGGSPTLGYFGHGQTLIGPDGRPPPETYRPTPEFLRQRTLERRVVLSSEGRSRSELESFVRRSPGNNSSIALRRSVLLRTGDHLRRVPYSIDTFLLYAGIVSGLDCAIDPTPWTRLRIHSVNMSQTRTRGFRDYLSSYDRMMTKFVDGHRAVLELVEERDDGLAASLVRRDLARLEHFRHVARRDLPRAAAARGLFAPSAPRLRDGRGWFASELAYVASPRLAQAGNFLAGQRRWGS